MELLESVSKSVTYDARSFSEPLSQEILFRWHKMIVSGRRDLKDVGRYRTGLEPMQVVSGAIHEIQ
jgi:S-adenosylmethionine:diacylglycerol 3-amino-3-carboxypropyl transferase